MPLIDPGHRAPAFSLPDADGNTVRLAQFRGQPVVLYFYPRDNTPGCTRQACDFSDAIDDFARSGAVVLGISPDPPHSHADFARRHSLRVRLLSDHRKGPDGPRVCVRYGVWREKVLYGRRSVGLVRTTYLIDPRGLVARRWDNVRVPGHVRRVLDALCALDHPAGA